MKKKKNKFIAEYDISQEVRNIEGDTNKCAFIIKNYYYLEKFSLNEMYDFYNLKRSTFRNSYWKYIQGYDMTKDGHRHLLTEKEEASLAKEIKEDAEKRIPMDQNKIKEKV